MSEQQGDQAANQARPGFLLRLRAKPGYFDTVLELAQKPPSDEDAPEHMVVYTVDDEPDTIWIIEFFKDAETFARHTSNPDVRSEHEAASKFLAEPPLRAAIRPVVGASEPTSGSR